ncbi:MAG: Uncharacterized protein MK1497 [uncultured Thermomicrobiales bacterium]|uniref:Uncharacterized protein MK1497 n=1 Tax=uncultured Thermomicrobiales bacterium TaxID=1645740 RepID=A0A6N3IPG6_9BACT|nr:MAG: Uncharacterized protein MK1497 [uncultured Thermomicrobiales bacterium]
MADAERILAIDVGAGTQDILLWEGDRTPENCTQLILPSQTQIVAARIRRLTAVRRPLHLTGRVMGGGASSDAIAAHLAAGLAVTVTPGAAKTIHDNPSRVEATGVRLVADAPRDAEVVVLGDVDPAALRETLERFEIPWPARFAVAVFDHGDSPVFSNRRFRFEHLARIIAAGGDLGLLVYDDDLPLYLTRMAAARDLLPGATVLDTGAAGVWGALEDPIVAARAERGAILVNIGNMHTFGVLLRGRRMLGLFEHHTHLLTTARLAGLVAGLRVGTLDFETIFAEDGHGATFAADYHPEGGFDFVAVTGPNRALARPLGWYEAVPHGDMMLAGPFGLIAAARDKAGRG